MFAKRLFSTFNYTPNPKPDDFILSGLLSLVLVSSTDLNKKKPSMEHFLTGFSVAGTLYFFTRYIKK